MRKQLSLGTLGGEEVCVSSPLSPAEIGQLLYLKVFPINPQEAVLQQEIVLFLGSRVLVTNPELLEGILFIRIGWVIEAIRLKLAHERPHLDIFSLSPSEIKTELEDVLRAGVGNLKVSSLI